MPDAALIALIARGGEAGWAAFVLLLLAVVMAVWRGLLIPRPTYVERVADLKETIADQRATIRERDLQVGILLGHRAADTPRPIETERV